jgi:hypothetical protein
LKNSNLPLLFTSGHSLFRSNLGLGLGLGLGREVGPVFLIQTPSPEIHPHQLVAAVLILTRAEEWHWKEGVVVHDSN